MPPAARVSGGLGVPGGLNRMVNPFLPARALYTCQGFYFDEIGSLTKVSGFIRQNLTQLLENGVGASFTGLFYYSLADQTTYLIATTPSGVYRSVGLSYDDLAAYTYETITGTYANPPSTWSAIETGLVRTVRDLTDFAVVNDILYLGDGVNALRKSTGQNLLNAGLAAPTTAPTVTVAAPGGAGLTGLYRYRVTFYNSTLGHESNPSPASAETAPNGQDVSLSSIPTSSDSQVNQRRLYRTTTGGGTYLFLATIDDNTTTTYTDSAADSTLGAAVELTAFGVPPVAEKLAVFNGMLFQVIRNSSRLWFSRVNFGHAVDAADFRDLDPSDGTVITGLKRLYTTLVVFKNNSIWNITGTTRQDVQGYRQVNGIGAVGHHGIVEVPGKSLLMFPSFDGFYAYNGSTEQYMSQEIESIYRGLNPERLQYMGGRAYRSRDLIVWLVSTSGSDQHNLLILYNYVQNKWATREIAATPANIIATIKDAALVEQFNLGGYGGYVWQGDTGTDDDGAAIGCEVVDFPHPQQGASDEAKSFSEVIVWFRTEAQGTVTVAYALDRPDAAYTTIGTIDLTTASGQARLSFDAYGKRLYLRFTNSAAGQPVVLRGWQVGYKSLGRVY